MISRNTLERLMTLTDAGEIRRLLLIDAQLDEIPESDRDAYALGYLAAYVAERHAGDAPIEITGERFKGFNDIELRQVVQALQVVRRARFTQLGEADAKDRKEPTEETGHDVVLLRAFYNMASDLHDEAEAILDGQLGAPDVNNARIRQANGSDAETPAFLKKQAD